MTHKHGLPPAMDAKFDQTLTQRIAIPPQPTVLNRLFRELSKDEPDLNAVKTLVKSDPYCSVSVLKLANSPLFARPSKITSVEQATSLLGTKLLLTAIASAGLRQVIDKPPTMTLTRFWDSSADVSRLSAYLAQQLKVPAIDDAYMLGLFRDCGIPLLAHRFSDYVETLRLANDDAEQEFTAIEERRHQTHHAVVGFYLAKTWNLAPRVQNSILLHHDVRFALGSESTLEATGCRVLACLKIAEYANDSTLQRPVHEWNRIAGMVRDYLALSEPDVEELVADALDHLTLG